MISTRTIRFVVLLVALAILGVGCSSNPRNEPDGLTDEQRAYRGAGYYEIRHEDKMYVVGSMTAADEVRKGNVPKSTVVRYSTGGTRVMIDATDPAEAARLTHEYDRRHRGG